MRAAHIIENRVANILIVDDLTFGVKEGFIIADNESKAEVGGFYINSTFYPERPSNADQERNRLRAYQLESDPLFFKYQRGDATEQEWKDKVAQIKARYPDYFDADGNLLEAQS
jgi:hypothetical protein